MEIDSASQARRRRATPTSSRSEHAHFAATTKTAPELPAPPSYLARKRHRRTYGDKGPMATSARSVQHEAGGPVAVNQLIGAMLRSHTLDWATTQRDNCRTYLLSPTGRFQQWCSAAGVTTVDALTTDALADFLAALGDRRHGAGLKASTVAKYRIHLRALARYQAQTPGYGDGLADIQRIPAPRMPKEQAVLALTRLEEEQVVAACTNTRDRLIIELLLATGVRVSEAAALVLPNVLLTARPPRVVVRGSVHGPECTKSGRPRQVPFRKAYASLPRRLTDWIATDRDRSGLSPR